MIDRDTPKHEIAFVICKFAGFGLMFVLWLQEGGLPGFFLLLFLVIMSLLRRRFPKLKATILLDCAVCLLSVSLWENANYALILVLFEAMYRDYYWAGFSMIYSFNIASYDVRFVMLTVLGALCGFFLGKWAQEQGQKLILRDVEAGKYYELEHRQSDIMTTLPQIERMTAVAERTRIARDIHDNAGHEIVAAYISLQTARGMLDAADADALELYDAAMKRLNNGVNKIRETAHNLQTVTPVGIETLLSVCKKFPSCPVDFHSYGNAARIPVYVWNMLEACLNESLTNVMRHAQANYISVELDVTQHIVRFCIENDGARKSTGSMGNGLRNLRHRAVSVGGSLSVKAGDVFRVICVIPIAVSGGNFEKFPPDPLQT